MVIDDAHFIESAGQLVCEWCYDSLVTRCERCGLDFFNTDLTYDKDIHSYVCSGCASHRHQRYASSYSSIADGVYTFE
jgi:protein-arginine kinase activator protein McsA